MPWQDKQLEWEWCVDGAWVHFNTIIIISFSDRYRELHLISRKEIECKWDFSESVPSLLLVRWCQHTGESEGNCEQLGFFGKMFILLIKWRDCVHESHESLVLFSSASVLSMRQQARASCQLPATGAEIWDFSIQNGKNLNLISNFNFYVDL